MFHDGVPCTVQHVLDFIAGIMQSVDTFGMRWSYARYLAQAGATVVLACRNAEKGEAARAEIAAAKHGDWEEIPFSKLATVVGFCRGRVLPEFAKMSKPRNSRTSLILASRVA